MISLLSERGKIVADLFNLIDLCSEGLRDRSPQGKPKLRSIDRDCVLERDTQEENQIRSLHLIYIQAERSMPSMDLSDQKVRSVVLPSPIPSSFQIYATNTANLFKINLFSNYFVATALFSLECYLPTLILST